MRILGGRFVKKCLIAVSVALTFAGVSTTASAAFFQLAENNASGLGNAYAGGAAIAEDASTVWYNPAGMTRLPGQQLVVAGHFIQPSFEFDKTSANNAVGAPISGGNGGDAGESALIPNIYYTQQLNEQMYFGFGLNAPFGLATEYDGDWVGRYHALRSDIKTINLNAAFAYKLSQQFSLGAGVNYQKLDAELSQAVDFGLICFSNGANGVCGPPSGNDGSATVTADDDAWGFNLGVLWQTAEATRIGAAYRSQMKYNLQGSFDITAPGNVPGAILTGGGLVDSGASANVTLPATASISLHQQITPQWTLLADFTRTFWGKLPELRIDFDSTQQDSVVTLNLKDANRYSVGANFAPSGTWVYRFGVAFDETPVPNSADRTPRLPDADRIWLALGAGYRPSPSLTFDFGYVYIMIDDADINKSATGENASRGSLVGSYDGGVHILSAQASWKF